MGEVIPFRRKNPQACSEHVHHFETVPGRCQCGENLWEVLDKDTPGIFITEAGFDSDRGEAATDAGSRVIPEAG